jgi:hypothetical protein
MTTHRNLAVMETIFTEALIPMSPAQKDVALGLLPFSRMLLVLEDAQIAKAHTIALSTS